MILGVLSTHHVHQLEVRATKSVCARWVASRSTIFVPRAVPSLACTQRLRSVPDRSVLPALVRIVLLQGKVAVAARALLFPVRWPGRS